VLDGNSPTAEQTAWLRAQLEAAERDHVPHVFVLLHQPPFSVGDHCGAALVMREWVELFERHRVRAVFAGHDHAYERMERNGVRYFVSGGAGAPLYAERSSCASMDQAALRVYRSQYHLLRVRVDRHSVEVTALPIDDADPPLDRVRFAADEPTFATDGPRLAEEPASRRPWLVGSGLGALALVGLFTRRRRR
jgi:3',5'-cyclic AMP phosphodiesterase CpdA